MEIPETLIIEKKKFIIKNSINPSKIGKSQSLIQCFIIKLPFIIKLQYCC